ncbi:MAG: hypothetical protein COA73_01945 [Candidatus Hydrogenedentota bacterium]|nr:MAG: hypothetical protein COA73_01945 [Candidatus Hydrogenedentota bacterium]
MASERPEFIGPKGGNGGFKLPIELPEIPKKVVSVLIGILAILILTVVLIRTCFTYIEPNEVGIKQVKVGVNQGIQEKVYGPGYAFRKPLGLEIIHRFPNQVLLLDLAGSNSAKIQTSDGFYVDVDVSILYKITDPYKVITLLGYGDAFIRKGIEPKAEPNLKTTLGELTTEDFYNSPLRVEKADLAKVLLNLELNKMGIEVDQVLVRYFKYSDEIQQNIEEKKLQDQLVFKNMSEGRAAIEAAQLKKVSEEGEAQVKITLEEGRAYKVRKEAERDLYVRSKVASADLLIQLAEAKRTELTNDAMQTLGADKAVALEMAEVLRGLEVMIIPTGGEGGFNPLDLDAVTKLLGVVENTKGGEGQ